MLFFTSPSVLCCACLSCAIVSQTSFANPGCFALDEIGGSRCGRPGFGTHAGVGPPGAGASIESRRGPVGGASGVGVAGLSCGAADNADAEGSGIRGLGCGHDHRMAENRAGALVPEPPRTQNGAVSLRLAGPRHVWLLLLMPMSVC